MPCCSLHAKGSACLYLYEVYRYAGEDVICICQSTYHLDLIGMRRIKRGNNQTLCGVQVVRNHQRSCRRLRGYCTTHPGKRTTVVREVYFPNDARCGACWRCFYSTEKRPTNLYTNSDWSAGKDELIFLAGYLPRRTHPAIYGCF